MQKQEAIQRFKDACVDKRSLSNIPVNFLGSHRRTSVKYQFCRDVFEVYDNNGQVQICGGTNPPGIHVWNRVVPEKDVAGSYYFTLTTDEYKELEKTFFGDYVPDYEYLERIGSIK